MRRLIFAIGMCLLFGAIVNVAVAWGITWHVITRNPQLNAKKSAGYEIWFGYDRPDHSSTRLVMQPAWEKAGWPVLALSRRLSDEEWMARYFPLPNSRYSFAPAFPDHLPMTPMPLGFTVNTLLYGLVPLTILVAPGMVKRWRRRHHGLCVKCAYPVGVSDVCSECGALVNDRARVS